MYNAKLSMVPIIIENNVRVEVLDLKCIRMLL
jgi:hypothetical protein